ncbi:acyltransferase family protein [Sanguibacter keddieii]|uniref:acyltransferase family protein n=1 Tax=Sanguibacter keddieii TaxID=60920 RepID=UPI00145D2918|nr:acyltransferase [Sanguibacter keddieii]
MPSLDTPTHAPSPTRLTPRPPGRPTSPVRRDGPRAWARDPLLDLLRAVGTVAVVVAHWTMPEVSWDGADLTVVNVLGTGPGWLVTWVVQVIPLMFFVAGAATLGQLRRRPETWSRFMAVRLRRLVPPVAVFVGTWVVLRALLPVLGVPGPAVDVAARIAPQMLWYLGVYVVLLAASPALGRWYDRTGVAGVAAIGAAAVGVDVLRFGADVPHVGAVNLFLVWAFAYTLGFAYTDGRLAWSARRCAAVAAAGLVGLALAVTVGPYPRSMVGMPGDTLTNMGPPTLCLVALALVQVFGALAVRTRLEALARTTTVARAVGWLSARSMTVYLWHLTAMFVVVGVVTVGAAVDLPAGWSTSWWISRPAWFVACAVVLLVLVRTFERFERTGTGTGARTTSGARAQRAGSGMP